LDITLVAAYQHIDPLLQHSPAGGRRTSRRDGGVPHFQFSIFNFLVTHQTGQLTASNNNA
jgi:hypothetical protein